MQFGDYSGGGDGPGFGINGGGGGGASAGDAYEDYGGGGSSTQYVQHEEEHHPVVELILPGTHGGSGSSAKRAFFNIVCFTTGAGTFGISYALKNMGWGGMFVIALAALASWYTGVLLHRCHQFSGVNIDQVLRTGLIVGDVDQRGNGAARGYEDIAKNAFGAEARRAVVWITYINQVGVSILYLILAGNNMLLLTNPTGTTPVFPSSSRIGDSTDSDLRLWIVCFSVLLLPLVCRRELRHIAVTSMIGVFCLLLSVTCVIGEAVAAPGALEDHDYGGVTLDSFIRGLATSVFAFSGHPVYPVVQSSMAQPSRFPAVLSGVYAFLFAVLGSVAAAGYYSYGAKTLPNVLRDLAPGGVTSFTILLTTAHLYLAIPVVLQPAIMALEKRFVTVEQERVVAISCGKTVYARKHQVVQTACRVVLVLVAAGFSVAVPFFGDVMSLLGATTVTLFAIVLPALMYSNLFWEKMSDMEKGICGLLLLGGFFIFVGGTLSAMSNIVKKSKDWVWFHHEKQ